MCGIGLIEVCLVFFEPSLSEINFFLNVLKFVNRDFKLLPRNKNFTFIYVFFFLKYKDVLSSIPDKFLQLINLVEFSLHSNT